jgi:hypothetical protein
MSSRGSLGNLGEPVVSWSRFPEEEGYRVNKSPGADVRLPAVREPATEDKDRKQTRYGIASAK